MPKQESFENMRNFLQNIDQSTYLAELIKREPNLEITLPVESDVLYFRYVFAGVHESDLDGINRVILYELWRNNCRIISDSTIDGKYMLKASTINQCSKFSDFDILVEQIITIGNIIVKEYL